MFRPKASSASLQGRSNLVGDKDRKNLRNQFVAQFPKHGLDVFNELFPTSEALNVFSVKAATCEVYISQDVPLLFSFSKKKTAQLYPTVFTLWQYPDLVPSLTVQKAAPMYLIRGADLMLPGVIPPEAGLLSTSIDLDQVWSVRCIGNPLPFAVGSVMMSRDELSQSEKGKLLQVQHVLGDLLYKLAPPATHPPGFTATTCEPIEITEGGAEDGAMTAEENAGEEDAAKAVDEEALAEAPSSLPGGGPMTFPPAAVDALMEFVLYDVLKKQIPSSSLPIDVSAILGRIGQNLPSVCAKAEDEATAWLKQRGIAVGSSGPTAVDSSEDLSEPETALEKGAVTSGWSVADMGDVDLKKSSWKSAKKFATHFKKTKIWTLKEVKGQLTIVKINLAHPTMQAHKGLPDSVIPRLPEPKESRYGSGSKNTRASEVEEEPTRTEVQSSTGSSSKIRPYTAYQATAATRTLLNMGSAFRNKADQNALLTEEEVKGALERLFQRLNRLPQSAGDQFPSLGDEEDESPSAEAFEKLPWHELVLRDQGLMNVCLTKPERQNIKTGGTVPPISEEELTRRFIANGLKVVTLLLSGNQDTSEALAKPQEFGMVEADAKITVSTHKTKRFTRTRVAGIHNFPMIDPKQLAERLQKACAASASVCELDDVKGKSKPVGVVVQGSVVREVCTVLESTYGLPKSMIQALA